VEKSTPTKVPIGLVFDLNGTLVKRAGTNNRTVYLRPHIHEFIEFVMKNFHIITWTTAKPHNSYKIICKAFGPYSDYILCNLTRLHCKVIGSYYHKSPTIKDLEVIWNAQFKVDSELATKTLPSPPTLPIFSEILNEETKLLDNPRVRDLYLGKDTNPQTLNNPKILQFNKTNTILLDDSPGKGEAQPLNHLVMPEYGGVDENNTDNSLLKLKQYLEEMIKEYKKTEAEGAQFSVQDYMKDKSFKDFLATENTTTSN
jgi:hydroxymethylpyrimidine pyrophosphatase-like HAD family hydrolase